MHTPGSEDVPSDPSASSHRSAAAGAQPHSRGASAHRRRPRRRRGLRWLLLAAALLIVLYLLFGRPQKARAPAAAPGVPVSTAKVTQGSIAITLDALGTVTPISTVTVTSRVSGAVTEIHYTEGQMVKKGDLLLVIDPRPYQAALTQASGQLAKDRALLRDAQIDLDRYEEAYRQRAIPEQQVATQRATVAADEGAVTVDQGNLAAAQVNVDYTRITSPIDGRVGLRLVDLGNIVSADGTTPLVTVAQLQPITVIFNLAEDDIARVAEAVRGGAPVRVDALDRSQERVLAQGRLLTLDNQINVATGTVRGRAVFANQDNGLFPNQFVNARLYLKTLTGVDLVPTEAIQRNNDTTQLYVVQPDQTVDLKNVVVTATQGAVASVTGVDAGDTVVTDGFDKLQNGTKVRPRQAGPPAGAK